MPRRKRRRKFVPGVFARYVFIGGTLAVLLTVCCWVGSRLIDPYKMGYEQARAISELNTHLNEVNSMNANLSMRSQALDRPEGIEKAARAAGYLKKGEVRLVLENTPPVTPDRSEDAGLGSKLRSAWLSIFAK